MKRNYISTLVALSITIAASAQIEQITDVNKTGDSGIGNPTLFNGEIYFEADAGDSVIINGKTYATGDELYKYTGSETVLVKNINQDTLDTSPNGDPQQFHEFDGKLYFQGNEGDKALRGKELFVTDGTETGTNMVSDLNPGPGADGSPMNLTTFNGKMYFTGTSTFYQLFSYDGVNAPSEVSNSINPTFNPSFLIPDGDKMWLQGQNTNKKNQLYILDTDDNFTLIEIDAELVSFVGSTAVLFNDGLLFQAADTDHGKELWFSNGTQEGTVLIKDIWTGVDEDNDANGSAPKSLTVVGNKAYFYVKIDDRTQLWSTDGTTSGTVLVYEPTTTADGEIANLINFNETLYFTITNDDAVDEFYMTDGVDVTKVGTIGDGTKGMIIAKHLLFFISGDALWVFSDEEDVLDEVNNQLSGGVNITKVTNEYVVDGTKLYFTADDENGFDDIYMVDGADIVSPPSSSIPENEIEADKVNVYPMPTTGLITIDSEESFDTYKVYDLSMKQMVNSVLEDKQINLSLPAGIYILQLINETSTVSKTIMIK